MADSPAVHLAHRRPSIALASFGVRTLPIWVFVASGGIDGWSCGENASSDGSASPCHHSATGPLIAIAIASAAALVVDDVVLAREQAPGANTATAWPTVSLARGVEGARPMPTFGVAGVL